MDKDVIKGTIMKRLWMPALCSAMISLLPNSVTAGPSRIDLEIESIQMQPLHPQAGEPVIVVAVVHNSGSQTVSSAGIGVSVRQGKQLVRAIQNIPVLSALPRMGSGKSLPIDIGNFAKGDYEVMVIADPENKIQEDNEANNTRIQGFHISAARYGY